MFRNIKNTIFKVVLGTIFCGASFVAIAHETTPPLISHVHFGKNCKEAELGGAAECSAWTIEVGGKKPAKFKAADHAEILYSRDLKPRVGHCPKGSNPHYNPNYVRITDPAGEANSAGGESLTWVGNTSDPDPWTTSGGDHYFFGLERNRQRGYNYLEHDGHTGNVVLNDPNPGDITIDPQPGT